MEWWQIFGILFLFFVGMFVYAGITKEAAKKNRKEALMRMGDPYQDGQWDHPGEMAKSDPRRDVQKKQRDEEHEESFITRLPKAVNNVMHRKIDKLNLKDSVEMGKLQLEHITNANLYADQYYDLQNKSKTNQAKGLELDRKIVENENELKDVKSIEDLRELRNKDKKLDLDISIAEKEARLDRIKNPPKPAAAAPAPPTAAEKKQQLLKEIDEKIERLNQKIESIKNSNNLSAESKQRHLNQLQNRLFELEEQQHDLL